MAKYRSKLKRRVKGKNWAHGHSSTTNPENQKYRSKALSKYFQADLHGGNNSKSNNNQTGLTLEHILRHDAQQMYKKDNSEPTVNDVANSLKSINLENDNITESQGFTFKTFQTFASNYSQCSNVSFSKLLNHFRGNSEHHKEMLATLSACTEIINERGGKQSSTEYFIILTELLDLNKTDDELISIISLLGLCVKTVPQAVLRKQFSEISKILIELIEKFINSDNQNIIRNIFGIISTVLRAQEYALWNLSSTRQILNTILSFAMHTKPKIRKSAHHAITSIILGSCFMNQSGDANQMDEGNNEGEFKMFTAAIQPHPASHEVTTFSINVFTPENIAKNQNVVLHILVLLRSVLGGLNSDDLKIIFENLLSMMTASNLMIRTNCLHTFHAFFSTKSYSVSSILIGKLISALYDYQPDRNDPKQTLAWLTVLKQGHIYLAILDHKNNTDGTTSASEIKSNLCMSALPKFFELCTTELWLYDRNEIINSTTSALQELLEECVKPICDDQNLRFKNQVHIKRIINSVTKCLLTPFGQSKKDVILILSKVYQNTGKYFKNELTESIKILGTSYDEEKNVRVQIEHAIISAISSTGPDTVLSVIPITGQNNNFILDRSWLLPLLREGIINSSFNYFTTKIIPLASVCNQKWEKFKKEGNVPMSHTHELLCCQLWGLFPGFCRSPVDPENFKFVAKTLGTILNEHPDLRPPVYDGMIELIINGDENIKTELKRYSKNFLPRLFNVYSTKTNGTYESNLRDKCFEVIKNYLTITPETTLEELFEHGIEQLKASKPGTFLGDSLYDIVQILAVSQNKAKLTYFFEKYITSILKHKKNPDIVAQDEIRIRKQQKKCYAILMEIMASQNAGCLEFIKTNKNNLEKLLTLTHNTTTVGARTSRIRCIYKYFQICEKINVEKQVIKNTITESIIVLHEFPKTDNVSQKTLEFIGNLFQEENKLNDFVDIIIAGFVGDETLITNTILALKIIVHSLNKNLSISTIEFMLDQVTAFLVGKNRKQAEAGLSFMITFSKVLPIPLIANHLEKVVRSMSSMAPDTKRFCRTQYGYVLKKLCKKFGVAEIIKLAPGNDEVTHKRLKRLRKVLSREKRKVGKKSKDDDGDEDDDENEMDPKERKSQTIDDILADSDSDDDNGDNSDDSELYDSDSNKRIKNGPTTKRRKRDNMFIQETPESIVDLADINTIKNISTTLPKPNRKADDKKDKNRGFKTTDDGRLIIADNSDDDDDDSDDGGDLKNGNTKEDDVAIEPKRKPARKGILDEMDSDDDENDVEMKKMANKQKFDGRSVTSRKSGSTKYTTGGIGIHRNTKGTATSVKSGVSSKYEYGAQYKAKKAQGDSKKQGLLDPYAYIPLSRQTLNKRKRAKNAGQFKNIVKGARKGATVGSKNKVRKAKMMK